MQRKFNIDEKVNIKTDKTHAKHIIAGVIRVADGSFRYMLMNEGDKLFEEDMLEDYVSPEERQRAIKRNILRYNIPRTVVTHTLYLDAQYIITQKFGGETEYDWYGRQSTTDYHFVLDGRYPSADRVVTVSAAEYNKYEVGDIYIRSEEKSSKVVTYNLEKDLLEAKAKSLTEEKE